MKLKAIVIIALLVLVAGSGILYALTRSSLVPSATPNPIHATNSPSPVTKSASDLPVNPGEYTSYSANVVSSTAGTKLLFFHAPWCPQCRALDKDISSTALPENLTIFKVDYDSNQALRQKYGVTIQTTVVKIDDDGNLLKKYVAYDQPTFAAVKQNLLE